MTIIPIMMPSGGGGGGNLGRHPEIPPELVADLKAGELFTVIFNDGTSSGLFCFPWWASIYRMEYDGKPPREFDSLESRPAAMKWTAKREARSMLRSWSRKAPMELYRPR